MIPCRRLYAYTRLSFRFASGYVSQINLLEGGIEGIRRHSSEDSSDDDEFFDAKGKTFDEIDIIST